MNFDELLLTLDVSFLLNYEKKDNTVYILRLKGKKSEWKIEINLDSFPHSLPSSKLLDEDLIGTLAHVNENGVICLEESDSIIINYTDSLGVLSFYIKEIIKLLDNR